MQALRRISESVASLKVRPIETKKHQRKKVESGVHTRAGPGGWRRLVNASLELVFAHSGGQNSLGVVFAVSVVGDGSESKKHLEKGGKCYVFPNDNKLPGGIRISVAGNGTREKAQEGGGEKLR